MNVILFHLHIHSYSQINKYGFIAYFIKRLGHRTMRSHTSYRMTYIHSFSAFPQYSFGWIYLVFIYSSAHYFFPSFSDLVFMDTTKFLSELIILEICQSDIFSRIFHTGNEKSARLSSVVGGAICYIFWCSYWPWERSVSSGKSMALGRESSEKAMKKVLAIRPQVSEDLVLYVQSLHCSLFNFSFSYKK